MAKQILDGDSGSDNDEAPVITINEEYARRYEHNKNREDLQRYEELKKQGLVSSSSDDNNSDSSSEDDDDVDFRKEKALEFFDAIIKVRKRDPSLQNKDTKLFKDDDDETENKVKKVKKKKSKYLKDVVAQQLMEDGPEIEEEDGRNMVRPKSYNEQQEENRRPFLDKMENDDDDDELLVEKKKNGDSDDVDDDDDDEEIAEKLHEVFGPEDVDNNKFLRDYFKHKMWKEKKSQRRDGEGNYVAVLLDKVEVEDQEDYEYEYELKKQKELEFRFQENAGDRVLGHARQVEGSVRKTVNTRKQQRKNKEERKEIARLEREEELRHLKNIKKKENAEKLKKIMEIAGIKEGECEILAKDFETEFHPQEYDRGMEKLFGDKYYNEEDAEFGSDRDEDGADIEKPDFDKEDELLGLSKGWESGGSGDGFLAAREKALKLMKESGIDVGEEEDSDEEDGEEQEEKEEDRDEEDEDEDEQEEKEEDDEVEEEEEEEKLSEEDKRKLAILEKAKNEMLDEYYKLDYEDTIGDLKTRFKYAKVQPNRYGLTAAEILALDEKELNGYVSLKKLAPYQEKEWKVPNSKRSEIKKRAREIFRHGKGNGRSRKKLKIKKDSDVSTATAEHVKEVQDSNGGVETLSRNARRKRNQKAAAVQPLPASRLAAYGETSSISKKKGKH